MNLFNLAPIVQNKKTCKQCKFIERWECGSKFFFYCGSRKSNRTDNGKLKVKCKTEACILFKEDSECKNK